MNRQMAGIRGFGILAGVVVVAACGDGGIAPPPAGSIAGEVTIEGSGLEGVTVSLSDGTTATTNAGGSFRFDGMAPGTYEVSISGYPANASFGTTAKPVTIGTEGGLATVAFGASSSDRNALVDLYNATDGRNWTNNANWLTTAPLGDWYGVTTDASGRVTALWLQANNLRGTIPAAVGGLTQLGVLALFREPGLTGSIPKEIGDLADLRLLALGGNDLTGAIPPELGNLTDLTGLYLWGNKLTGTIPSELGKLSKLQVLQLDGPEVTAAAHANRFSGGSGADLEQSTPRIAVPYRLQEFGDDSRESADIAASRNNVGLTGPVPAEIWNLKNLTLLTLARNRLTGRIPPEIGNLTNLEQFSVQDNQLTGTLPASLWTLTDLTVLVVAGNQLTGSVPPEIADLRDLEIFWAATNDLSGSIPPEIGHLGKLTHLGLHENSLSGNIPSALGDLTSLVQLTLSRNDLRGAIPSELGDLRSLEVLLLNENRLDGGVPSELGNLSSLVSLSLRDNDLTGTFPAEIGNLSNLVRLWVYRNPLSGSLPLTMTRLANLSEFNFSETQLCVPDDATFVSWLQLVRDVTRSGLDCGTISRDRTALVALYNATGGANWSNNQNWLTDAPLSDWHGVTTDASARVSGLDLSGNNLSGVMPPELGNLANLEELVLEGNNLTGPVPSVLGALSQLEVLLLAHNRLTGPIPASFLRLDQLDALFISWNKGLCFPASGAFLSWLGGIHELEGELCEDRAALLALYHATDGPNWTNNDGWLTDAPVSEWAGIETDDLDRGWVKGLGLGSNNLVGRIPPELGDLTQLEVLALVGNARLTGSIPARLGNLASLTKLLLFENDLTGSIPPELGGLSRLEALALNNNQLTSPVPSELGNLSELEGLYLHDNLLTGPVPESFLSLDQLQVLSIVGNSGLCFPDTPAFRSWLEGLDAEVAGTFCQDAGDRAVLVALYEANGGANWKDNENWLTGAPLREWAGVSTDSLGRVAGLFLGSNNLVGTLPPELGNLSRLRLLFLDNNQVTGPVPDELGNLSQLSRLYVVNNDLTGTIPDSFLRLERLEEFYFSANHGLCVPNTDTFTSWLSGQESYGPRCGQQDDYAALAALYDASSGDDWTNNENWLTAAPLGDWYGVTTYRSESVTHLVLERNNLTGLLPPEIGDLAKLTWLNLLHNELEGPIPPELADLDSLTALQLSDNNLSDSIPRELGRLANLTDLALGTNDLSGSIPPELGNLTNLKWLSLQRNDLVGSIPDSFLQLQRLENLYVDTHNCVPGIAAFQVWLGRIQDRRATLCNAVDRAALVSFYQATDGPNWANSENWLTAAPLGDWHGVTTDRWGKVISLHLQDNNLTGQIPAQLGNLANLTNLALVENNLTGSIPPEFGNLANLHGLSLVKNSLTGPIPAELGNLTGLTHVFLWGNALTGHVPDSFLQLERLVSFYVDAGNCVPETNAFKAWLNRIQNHRVTLCAAADRAALMALYDSTGGSGWLDASNWNTETPLGDWYGVTTDDQGRVTKLSLEANQLIGPIPPQLGNLSKLTHLYLTGNGLSGEIPREFGRLDNLVFLSLRDNFLHGPIPPEFGRLDNLEFLYLTNNSLDGPIPREFTRLCNLKQLYLDRNHLSELPRSPHPCFGQELEVLHLHANSIVEVLPSWLANLQKLTYLTLHGLASTCLPATDRLRAWVRDLHERGALAEAGTPAWCGDGFWFTWRFEQTTTGRGWTGDSKYKAAHRIHGKPMLLRIFMGMNANTNQAIKSPRMRVEFGGGGVGRTVYIPEGAIADLGTPRDEAFVLDLSYRFSINILIPGDFARRGRDPSINVFFDPHRTFRQIVGNRMPGLDHDRRFAPTDWVRRLDYGQTYEILSGHDANPRVGWPTQEMPPARVLLVALGKSESDDRGMATAVRDLVRKGSGSEFFWETRNLLPIGGLEVARKVVRLSLGYHPTEDKRGRALLALGRQMLLRTFDDGYDYVVGIVPGRGGTARRGKRSSIVGYNGGSESNALAHELGHNMNLKHAPCNDTKTEMEHIDDDYPWPNGNIGVGGIRGIDLGVRSFKDGRVHEWGGKRMRTIRPWPVLLDPGETRFIVDGDKPDVMSYCDDNFYPTTWISQYHFDKALNYRQPATSDAAGVASAAPVNALILAGGRDSDGELFLLPAFVGEANPLLPQGKGQYRVGARDVQGRELFSFDFDMDEVADGAGAAMFVFAVPVREEWAHALTDITLVGPEGSTVLDRDGATVSVLLRDASGEVRGILDDWDGSALTASDIAAALGDSSIADMDVQISRGIPDASYWRRR